MKIVILESFYTGSHKQWADTIKKYSSHNIDILSLPGRFWKWRMHGAAISLSKTINNLNYNPDLILVSDMINLPILKSLIDPSIPIVLYFHENQLTYPWSQDDPDLKKNRENNYAFINYSSALVADKVCYNSNFQKKLFLESLLGFLKQFPDHKNIWSIESISNKSEVLYLPIEFPKPKVKIKAEIPVILWNHRWEYDKNPELFFRTLERIKEQGVDFKLIVLGEKTNKYPTIFDQIEGRFEKELLHFGYVDNRSEYFDLLQKSDILPVCANQENFGISVAEAISCGATPLLPNRLVYPELYPEIPECFYNDDMEFISKLVSMLTTDDNQNNYKHLIEKFDVVNQIKLYDKLFESFLSNLFGLLILYLLTIDYL